MPRLTKAFHEAEIERTTQQAFSNGKRLGAHEKEQELKHEFAVAKLQQMQAAAKLAEEVGRMASRIGYMIGKINGDNSR